MTSPHRPYVEIKEHSVGAKIVADVLSTDITHPVHVSSLVSRADAAVSDEVIAVGRHIFLIGLAAGIVLTGLASIIWR